MMMPSINENVGEDEIACTAGWSVKRFDDFGEQFGNM